MDEQKILERLGVLEVKVANMETEIIYLKGLIGDIHEMSLSVALVAEQIKNVTDDIKELKEDVQKIQAKPQDRLELIVKTILTAVISAIVAYFIAKIK